MSTGQGARSAEGTSGGLLRLAAQTVLVPLYRPWEVRTKQLVSSLCLMGALSLAGCAGSTSNPVFNTAVKKACIHAPDENRAGIGIPPIVR